VCTQVFENEFRIGCAQAAQAARARVERRVRHRQADTQGIGIYAQEVHVVSEMIMKQAVLRAVSLGLGGLR
jgi:hypothetical protein